MIRPGIRRLFRLPLHGGGLTERDLDEEMRLHLELRIEQLERQGLSEDAARAEAWRRFDYHAVERLGSAARRRDRRLRLVEWWSNAKREVGYGLRAFSRRPFYAFGVAGTLALGGAAALVGFVVAWSVWLAPLPYPDPSGLVPLGARDAALVGNAVLGGLALAGVGIAIGLAAWYRLLPWTSRWIADVDGAGLLVPAVVSLVIGGACIAATLGPARRAARVDPVRILNVDG